MRAMGARGAARQQATAAPVNGWAEPPSQEKGRVTPPRNTRNTPELVADEYFKLDDNQQRDVLQQLVKDEQTRHMLVEHLWGQRGVQQEVDTFVGCVHALNHDCFGEPRTLPHSTCATWCDVLLRSCGLSAGVFDAFLHLPSFTKVAQEHSHRLLANSTWLAWIACSINVACTDCLLNQRDLHRLLAKSTWLAWLACQINVACVACLPSHRDLHELFC
jgi:hypothetical protein